MKELTPTLLEDITRSLQKAINPVKIYLFGSYAAGCANVDSDIDLLVVIADTDKSRRDISLKCRSSLRNILFPLDIIVCTVSEIQKWKEFKCTLIYTVTRKGKILYESEGRTGQRMAQIS
jgi:uncharacterized protein